jgi:DNA-binding response OmpR family regulator
MSECTKLLIIDDDPDFVEGIRSILEGAGYAVDAEYNPDDGFKTLQTYPS